MNRTPAIAAAIGATLIAAPAAPAPAQVAGWNGCYVWEEEVGRHGGPARGDGIVAFITYTLRIGPGNGSNGCTLNGQGLQTNKRIRCTVVAQRGGITVNFDRYGADTMFDDGYRRGQALFALKHTPRGIVTTLQALTASSDTTPRAGTLFRKVG